MTDDLRTPLIVCMAQVTAEPVSWIWPPYIPRRKVTLLEGDPGAGKTWLALMLASIVTRGDLFPHDDGVPEARREPANVVYLSAEDGLGDTLRPRLDAAGADVSRVHALVGWQQGDMQGPISLGDSSPIAQALETVKPALVIIDPLQAYLGASVDMHRANETRPVLTSLAALAETYDCAILVIRHLGKSSKDRAVYRGLGSIDFAAAARSILLAGQDPQSPHRRVLAHVKSSLAALGPSMGYELREGQFFWTGRSDVTAEDLLRPYMMDEERSAVEEAEDLLRETLADGEKPAKVVFREAKRAGVSERTLRRAKKGLVKVRKAQVPGQARGTGPWMWSLVAEKSGQAAQDGQSPHREDMAIFKNGSNHEGNQCLIQNLKHDHAAISSDNDKYQLKQSLIEGFKDDHAPSVGASESDGHLKASCEGWEEL
jgi:hypothetical protein